jgi:hypothetical protein
MILATIGGLVWLLLVILLVLLIVGVASRGRW